MFLGYLMGTLVRLYLWATFGRLMGTDGLGGGVDLGEDLRQSTQRLRPYKDGDPRAKARLGSTYVPCRPCEGLGTATCLAVGCGPQCTTCGGAGEITCARCTGAGMVWGRRAA